MQKSCLRKMPSLFFALAYAGSAAVSGGVRAAVHTVPAGETLAITDGTVGDYADGIVLAAETSTVTFETTHAPTMSIAGAGTVRKLGTAKWTLTNPIPDFSGEYDIAAGEVVLTSTTGALVERLLGADTGDVYVRDGAALVSVATNNDVLATLGNRVLHLAGTGVNGGGAFVCSNKVTYVGGNLARRIKLESDATVRFNDGFYAWLADVSLDLNGHDLTIDGSGTFVLRGSMSGDGDVLVKEGISFRVRGGTMTASAAHGFRLRGGRLCLEDYPCEPLTHDRPVWVEEDSAMMYSDSWNHPGKMTPAWDNIVGWEGEISISAGKRLSFSYESESTKHLFVFVKGFTGSGTLELDYASDAIVVNPNPSFSGAIYFNHAFGFHASGPGFVSDYANLTRNPDAGAYYPGLLYMTTYEDEVKWTWADAVALANAATWSVDRFPRFAGAYTCTNGAAMPLALDPTVKLAKMIGSTTEQTFTGATTEGLNDFNWGSGLAVLTGSRPIALGDMNLETRMGDKTAVGMLVTNGTVRTTTTNFYRIGSSSLGVGRLVVSNAVWASDLPESCSTFPTGSGGFSVGHSSQGELVVERGAVITNKLFVSCGEGLPYNANTGNGGVVQNGGEFVVIGSTKLHQTSMLGGGGSMGSYILNDGLLELRGYFCVGGYNLGHFIQRGGDVLFTNALGAATASEQYIGASNGGAGVYRVTGGTARFCASLRMRWSGISDSSFAALSVEGPRSRLSTTYIIGNNASGGRPSSTILLSNGGTLRTEGICSGIGESGDSKMWVNFDGGILEATADLDVFRVTGSRYRPRVVLYKGGMTLKTDKSNVWTTAPIEGPNGKGIKAISCPTLTGTPLAAPVVNIRGDGYGALAMADFDEKTHTVTGITVVSPGCNYTCATAEVFYANSNSSGINYNAPTLTLTTDRGEIALDDNVNTGAFTKDGSGIFTLKATNTWGGATIVRGGKLAAGCDWAVPANSQVVLAGGDLDFCGNTGVVSKVTYGARGGRLRNANRVEKPAKFNLSISAEEIAENKPIVLTGDVDLADADEFTLTGDVSALDCKAHPELRDTRRYILHVENGALTGTFDPAWVSAITATYPDWKLRQRAKDVYLAYSRGMLLIAR